jgi:hypothetical protein
MVKIAFDDPSWRSNPRMPLMPELAELFWQAYRGRGRVQERLGQESRVQESQVQKNAVQETLKSQTV